MQALLLKIREGAANLCVSLQNVIEMPVDRLQSKTPSKLLLIELTDATLHDAARAPAQGRLKLRLVLLEPEMEKVGETG